MHFGRGNICPGILFSTLLTLLAGCSSDGRQDLSTAPEARIFQEPFEKILDNLVANHWSHTGDWKGDAQGDATAFAPMLLYPLSQERDDPDLTEMATTTVDHEIGLVGKLIGNLKLSMDVVIGFPALAHGYRYTQNPIYKNLLTAGAHLGYSLTASNPELLLPYVYDYATVYGTVSYVCFEAYEALATESLRENGIALIEQADKRCWNEDAQMYDYSTTMSWTQAAMLMALTRAYRATGQKFFLRRSEAVLHAMDRHGWDYARGGYYSAENRRYKSLSGNNNMTWALLDLYESTGNRTYLDQAQLVLEWILSDDLYDPEARIIYHHWTDAGDGTGQRSIDFCTGCNFETLYNIYRLNRLRHAHPAP